MQTMEEPRKIWGVLGGMGPLSSAEFLKTIYLSCNVVRDQDFPVVFVFSDPTFPDRTEALRSGNDEQLLQHLTRALEKLVTAGCGRIVICCMTIHALIPRLRADLQSVVVSLAEILLREASQRQERYLLLCSNGTRETRLFESHPLWGSASEVIVLPDDGDQRRIHRAIYGIKTRPCGDSTLEMMRDLLTKYAAGSLAVGCSEIHIIARYMEQRNALPVVACIDPFSIIAREIANSAGAAAFVAAEKARQA